MKKFTTEIKWSLIFIAASLGWMVIEKLMGWHGPRIEQHPIFTNLFAIVAIAVYVLAIRDKRERDLGGRMSWKQGFCSGALISLLVAILSPLQQLVVHHLISPEYFPNVIAYVTEHDLMPEEKAKAYFSLKNYILQSSLFALIMGLVTSAIVALFLRRKPQEMDA